MKKLITGQLTINLAAWVAFFITYFITGDKIIATAATTAVTFVVAAVVVTKTSNIAGFVVAISIVIMAGFGVAAVVATKTPTIATFVVAISIVIATTFVVAAAIAGPVLPDDIKISKKAVWLSCVAQFVVIIASTLFVIL